MLFPKRVGGPRDGQYAGLDFGHLVDLAAIDRELRGFLLPLTLDVENSAKTRLIERITAKQDEDGYSIFFDYLVALNHDAHVREAVRAAKRCLPRAARFEVSDRRDAGVGLSGAVVVRRLRRLLPLLRRPMGRFRDEGRALHAQARELAAKRRGAFERHRERAWRTVERAAAEIPGAPGRGSRRDRRVQAPQALEDAQPAHPADDRLRLRLLQVRS